MFNPIIRGWIQYYGRYYRSALYPTMRELDRDLVLWVVHAILMSDVIHHANVGVVQARNGLGFSFESLLADRIAREMLRQNLDGDRAFQPGIPRSMPPTHPAGAQRRNDSVASKPCTGN